MLVEEAFNSKFVAVFDPLDGSSNIDAAISTGTIFGIFEETEVLSLLGRYSMAAAVSHSSGIFRPYVHTRYESLWNMDNIYIYIYGDGEQHVVGLWRYLRETKTG